jgi:hypothetical protein
MPDRPTDFVKDCSSIFCLANRAELSRFITLSGHFQLLNEWLEQAENLPSSHHTEDLGCRRNEQYTGDPVQVRGHGHACHRTVIELSLSCYTSPLPVALQHGGKRRR